MISPSSYTAVSACHVSAETQSSAQRSSTNSITALSAADHTPVPLAKASISAAVIPVLRAPGTWLAYSYSHLERSPTCKISSSRVRKGTRPPVICFPNSNQAVSRSLRWASVLRTFEAPMPATARSSAVKADNSTSGMRASAGLSITLRPCKTFLAIVLFLLFFLPSILFPPI